MTTKYKTAKLILWIEPDLKRWAVSKAEEWGMSGAEFVRWVLEEERRRERK